MTQLNRVRVQLTGFIGAPGVATFYFLGLQTARQSLQSLFTAVAPALPDDVTAQVEAAGDIIESTNGALVGSWSKDPLPPIVGQQVGGYAGPAGCMLRWNTNGIVGRRRVRGRTFLVPLAATNYNTVGQILPAVVSGIAASANAFVFEQSLDFVIWSRPFIGAPATPTRAARPARLGSHSLVTSATVPTKVVVLRSRRD